MWLALYEIELNTKRKPQPHSTPKLAKRHPITPELSQSPLNSRSFFFFCFLFISFCVDLWQNSFPKRSMNPLKTQKLSSEEIKSKTFQIRVPAHCWQVPRGFTLLPGTFLVPHLINLFLQESSADEFKSWTEKKGYLRFLFFQDEKFSAPYVYGYVRLFADCPLVEDAPENQLLVEINLNTRGHWVWMSSKKVHLKQCSEADLSFVD